MKLIIVPAYTRAGFNYTPKEGHFLFWELLDNMRKKGQLEGVEIDIDEGWHLEQPTESRGEEFLANITPGFLKRVREYSEGGKYDAIVSTGALEPGFFAIRVISKIPVASSLHSAVHLASLLGDRFAIIEPTDPMAQTVRHYVQNFGLSHKLVSVRTVSRSSTYVSGLLRKSKKEERIKDPEVKKLVDDLVSQCVAAIEKDRADTLIISCPPLQILEDEIRHGLDELGYNEIQMMCEIPAAVEMAKVMVSMKLIQAPRAYPSDDLKAKPEFR